MILNFEKAREIVKFVNLLKKPACYREKGNNKIEVIDGLDITKTSEYLCFYYFESVEELPYIMIQLRIGILSLIRVDVKNAYIREGKILNIKFDNGNRLEFLITEEAV